MLTRTHISAVLALAVVVWTLGLLIQGVEVTPGHYGPFSATIAVLVLVSTAFNLRAWRMPWLHGWFVKRPFLRGTWEIELKSNWIDPDSGENPPPIKCYYGIEQTFSTLKMHLMTPESESWLIASDIKQSTKTAGYQVYGIYTNQPKSELRGKRSEIHHGAFVFDFHGSENCPNEFSGEYWTDRGTTGVMRGTRVSFDVLTTHAGASNVIIPETLRESG